MTDSLALKIAELKRRRGPIQPSISLSDFCFPEQLAFIEDQAQFKTAVCSRRAGKTIACAVDLIHTAINHPDVVCLYITLKRNNAKRLLWPEIKKINEQFNLGGHESEADLSMTFKNKSVIYCTGAKDKSEIENFRGLPIKKVYIDECQSFRAYIEELVDDVLSKALFDYAGTLCLIGTPGMVPTGYFYNQTKSSAYRHHFWTMFQNPHLERKSGKTVDQLVDADCERMGVTRKHPKIQRECFGKWVADPDSMIFKYNAEINHFDALPVIPGNWSYVIGVDLGHDDADAIAVIGWNEAHPCSYLIEELIKPKQGITELADQIEERLIKYNPIKIVMDTGALGKKIAKEIQGRRSLPIEPAEKSRKMEFIELLNDAMRTKRFMAKKDSAFAQDCALVEKDKDKSTAEKTVISDVYHSDICDAVLYGWRESLHWLHTPAPPPAPKPGTPEWFKREEEEMERRAEENHRLQTERDEFSLDHFNFDLGA